MARNKNAVSLIGQIGKDAEVRQTQQGVPYARFTLATTSGGYKKRDGTEVPEQTEWHNITCWRELANIAGKFCKKGIKIDVEGSLHYGQFTDQQGVTHYTTEIVANDLVLMSKPQGVQNGANTAPQQGQANNYPPQQNNGGYAAPQGQYGNYGGGYAQQQPQQAVQQSVFPPAGNEAPPF